jgi:hypothetical protein
MLDENAKREVQRMIDLASRRDYSKRVGDTPNDSLQLVPKKYVELAATTANRPASVVSLGSQQFFNLSTNYPWFFSPNSSVWVSATGSVVAGNL